MTVDSQRSIDVKQVVLSPDDTLFFLHIPKTAGRSVRAVLESNFDHAKICPATVLPELHNRSPSDLDQWRLFCGHYGKYLHELLERPPVTVTFLRDPVARSVSHYRDLQTREGTWLHEWVNTHSFNEFVLDEVMSTEITNLQARHLAFDDIQEDYYGYSDQRVNALPALMRKLTDVSLFDRALSTLDSCAFVGLQERFDESLHLLAATFGWPAPQRVPRHNTARRAFDTSVISEEVMERLGEITAIDRELWVIAAGRLENTLAGLTPEREDECYRRAMAARPKVSRYRLGFERAIFGRGWYKREKANGIVRRWMGPGTSASIDIPLATDRQLRLRFMAGAQARDVSEGAGLSLNGVEIPLRSWQTTDPATSQRVFDAVLPAEVLASQPEFARLEFRVPRTICPAEQAPGAKDKRHLGLCFEWLEILPHGCGA